MKKNKKKLKQLITFIILILLILLIIIYRYYKYRNIENEYIKAATFIYNERGIENIESISEVVLTRNEMNFLIEDNPLDNKCNGYVIITNINNKPKYKAYITCGKKYTTKDFERKFLD